MTLNSEYLRLVPPLNECRELARFGGIWADDTGTHFSIQGCQLGCMFVYQQLSAAKCLQKGINISFFKHPVAQWCNGRICEGLVREVGSMNSPRIPPVLRGVPLLAGVNTLMRTVDNGKGIEHKEMESILADKCCERKCGRG